MRYVLYHYMYDICALYIHLIARKRIYRETYNKYCQW